MAGQILLGDLRERPDGGFDGWCWAPDRPDERLVVDLLVNDQLAASMVAAIFRRDLLTRGLGDGRHGFAMHLPGGSPALAGDMLITARERRSGTVFGRVLREAPAFAPQGGVQLDRLEQSVAELWQKLAQARQRGRPPSQLLREVLPALADRLRARARGRGAADGGAALPSPWSGAGLPAGPPLQLPALADPDMTVAFAARDAAIALRRIAALAPALALARAELLVVDPGCDPLAAQLPARARNLRYWRVAGALPCAALNSAVAQARGRCVALLNDGLEAPSAAALLALARAAGGGHPALWLGSAAMAALALQDVPAAVALRLPARLGLVLCLDRDAAGALGPLDPALDDGAGLPGADLALKARLLGVAVLGVAEPEAGAWSPVARADHVAPAAMRAARASFRQRWGPLDPGGTDA
jgi:hypothetical protein